MRPAGGSDGFTLVETLASLTLLAMLSLLLVVGAQAARLRLARLDQTGQGETIEAAQTLLRARIERSFPLTTLVTPSAMIDFDGRNDQMTFAAPAPQSHGPDAINHYALALAPNGDLALDFSSDWALDAAHGQNHVVLLRRVAGLDLAYFGAAGPNRAAQWTDRWQQRPTLPRLVRIRVGFGPRDGRRWPDLIIGPAANLDSACAVEPNTGHCRGRE